ncbi:MAG: hypothetical protein LOX97_09175 [Sphingomonas sp.]|nr:hypothetical protein [Sphingomonas sp.]
MHRCQVDQLDPRRSYWVASVVAPHRDWAGAPGCRCGARLLVDRRTMRASSNQLSAFSSQLRCLQWIMRHRLELNHSLPGAKIRAVELRRWLLGLE